MDRLFDNQSEGWASMQTVDAQEASLLRLYSGKTLGEFKSLAGDRLVVLGDGGGNANSLPFFWLENSPDPDIEGRVEIGTGNLMGVLNLVDRKTGSKCRVEVGSRFDKGSVGQPFLSYLLSKVYDVSYLDLVNAGELPYLEILLAIKFVSQLSKARQVGLYRDYRNFKCNDMKPRGRIDFARHLRKNMPLGASLAYEKREISYDLPINHLLRMAAQRIEQKWPLLFVRNVGARAMLTDLKVNTPSYLSLTPRMLLASRDCRESMRHPYFSQYYEELRVLARLILAEEGADVFEDDDNEVSGVLFDGAWLWEAYLATILEPCGYLHAICETNIGRRPLFNRNPIDVEMCNVYPDFYREVDGGAVLDAKYKRGKATREDVLQMMAYVLNTGASRIGLVYPPDGSVNVRAEHFESQVNKAKCKDPTFWRSFQFEAIKESVKNDVDAVVRYMERQESMLAEFATCSS